MEGNGRFFFEKYLYDKNGRLARIESASDHSLFSSYMPVDGIKTELMTSQNSTVNRYSLYEYDKASRLSKIKNYYKGDGEGFKYISFLTFEYKSSNIVKVNLHEASGKITHYNVFAYDNKGNVINEKYYSNVDRTNELISEFSYKYDNYKNPYRIFSMVGSPGFYSNVNNIIETNTTRHYEVQGFDKYSTDKRSYEYNSNGYPVKEINGNSEFEYQYNGN